MVSGSCVKEDKSTIIAAVCPAGADAKCFHLEFSLETCFRPYPFALDSIILEIGLTYPWLALKNSTTLPVFILPRNLLGGFIIFLRNLLGSPVIFLRNLS